MPDRNTGSPSPADTGMTTYRYPTSSLAADYGRAAIAIPLAAILPFFTDSPIAFTIIAMLALIFGVFGVSVLMKQLTAVTLSEDGVSTSGPRPATVRWQEIDRIDLRYFSTRRDREKGWMQLRLGGRDQSVCVDSTLEGFIDIARAAAEAAGVYGVTLSPVTEENFRAIGIEPPPPSAPVGD